MQLKRLQAQYQKSRLIRRGFNVGYLPEDLELAARREEIAWVHSNCVCEIVPVQDCKDAGKKLLDLFGVDTDKSVDPAQLIRKYDRDFVSESTRRRDRTKFKELYLRLSCFLQCHILKLYWCLSQS